MAGLKLRAADAEDLAVISAILQDSLVTVAEMAYLADESRFVLVANRFKWEPQEGAVPAKGERVLTGLCIDGVKSVSRRACSKRTSCNASCRYAKASFTSSTERQNCETASASVRSRTSGSLSGLP